MRAAIFSFVLLLTLTGQPSTTTSLTGRVSSVEEGAMEGVLVSAKKIDSTITVTVVTDQQGQYRFPSAKLQPGRYALRIRAVGYDLDTPPEIDIPQSGTAAM